jgi:Putative lumazine-binding
VVVAVSTEADRAAIVETALDYFEGWFDGDAERLGRALHPELVKRGPKRTVTREQMVAWTEAGEGKAEDPGPDRRIDVTVADVYEDIASAFVDSDVYREYLQLVRTDDGWRIIGALWRST